MARTLHPQLTTPHLGGINSKGQDSQPMHQGIQAVLPLVAILLQVLPLVAIILQVLPLVAIILQVLPLVDITLQGGIEEQPLVAITLQGATEEQLLQEGGCMEHSATEPRPKARHLV